MSARKKVKKWKDIKERLSSVEVIAETVCYPSEDRNKVKRALLNVLDGNLEEEKLTEGRILLRVRGRGEEAVKKIFDGFRSRAVLAAVRKHLKERVSDDKLVEFMLNKQAAYVNVIAIFEEGESALGGIRVVIKGKGIKSLINWLTRF